MKLKIPHCDPMAAELIELMFQGSGHAHPCNGIIPSKWSRYVVLTVSFNSNDKVLKETVAMTFLK